MSTPAPFKVAAVQAAPVFMDLHGTVKKTIKFIEEAAKGGAKLVNFAETWIPGYPLWAWVGPVANSMMSVIPYNENSLEIDSDEFRSIQTAARKNDIFVCFGFSERHRGTLYISQALIDNNGEIVFTRRKLKPTHVERTIFGNGDGSDFQVAETEIGNVGALACWEHIQPLSKYVMFNDNEQIHCAAWPFLSMYEGIAYSLGAGPDGSQISEDLPGDQEGLVYADIDLSMIHIARAAADPAGHYARPDVVQVLLDRTKKTPVVEKTLSQPSPVEDDDNRLSEAVE